MNALLKYFINNAVATNLVMLVVIILGLFTFNNLRIEAFPKVPASTITITTLYEGASAKQVDKLVTKKIENSLEGIAGIKKVYASSSEGFSTITVQKTYDTDVKVLKEDISNKIDEIYDFPLKMRRPIFNIDDFSMTAMYVTLSGDLDTKTLDYFGERVRKSLLQLPEISKIDLWGSKSAQIHIELHPNTLEKYNITLDDINNILSASFTNYVDGTLKKNAKTILINTNKTITSLEDLKNIPILLPNLPKEVLLSDLANVVNSYEEDYIIARFDNEAAYGMEIKITAKDNVIDIAKALKTDIEKINQTLPSGLKLTYWGDSSDYISSRLSLLNYNAMQGILIVFVLLAIFLNIKLAFWIAMGIPISIAGSVAILGSPWLDYSINDITTLGLILSLGLLVDDAIVIGESVFTQRKKNKNAKVATIKGVHRVAIATIFGALTTVAAFIPMFLIQDELMKILTSFSIVVIITLLVSLLESKLILPSHLAHIDIEKSTNKAWFVRLWHKIQDFFQNMLRYVNYKLYAPVLEQAIKHRYAVIIIFLSFSITGLTMMFNGVVKTVFYPEIPQQSIQIVMEMDKKAESTLTKEHIKHIKRVLHDLNLELKEDNSLDLDPIKHTFMQIQELRAEVYIELSSSQERKSLDTIYILNKLKENIDNLEAVSHLEFTATEELAGKFAVNIYSDDEEMLKKASKELVDYLKSVNGVSQIQSSLKNSIPKLEIHLKPIAYKLGFDENIFSQQMSQYFSNTEIFKIIKDNKERAVILKQYDINRDSMADVLNIRLQNRDGKWYPLSSITSIKKSVSVANVNRENSKIVNIITAVLDKNIVTTITLKDELFGKIIKDIKQQYPNVSFDEAGELKSIGVAKENLIKALIITMILIYVLLAMPLKSYTQPFVIMSVIPFAFIGAMLGHMIEGFTFSIFSFLGILALIGIVVNDSLVMVTHYNQKKEENLSTLLAIRSAGVGRFRAIFLTTITTVLGLMPLINETSENAQYLIPTAISLAYGEIFATLLVLILIPVIIVIQEDIKILFLRNKTT